MSQWERLVTEGHVRAARWRAAVKFVVAIAVCLIVVGLIGLRTVPGVESTSRVVQAKRDLVSARQSALAAFIADKGTPPATLPADAEKAIHPNEMGGLITQLLGSLGKSNALPSDIKSLDPKTFWGDDWTPGAVAAVGDGSTILIGFYVNEAIVRPPAASRFGPGFGQPQQEQPGPQLVRVFGLFHRSKTVWSFYCLAVPRAAPCGRGEFINPLAIPATLRELMPDAAFEPRKDARP